MNNQTIVVTGILIVAGIGAILTYPTIRDSSLKARDLLPTTEASIKSTENSSIGGVASYISARNDVSLQKNKEFHEAGGYSKLLPCADQLPSADKFGKKIDYEQSTVDEYKNCQGFGVPAHDKHGKLITYSWE